MRTSALILIAMIVFVGCASSSVSEVESALDNLQGQLDVRIAPFIESKDPYMQALHERILERSGGLDFEQASTVDPYLLVDLAEYRFLDTILSSLRHDRQEFELQVHRLSERLEVLRATEDMRRLLELQEEIEVVGEEVDTRVQSRLAEYEWPSSGDLKSTYDKLVSGE